MVLSSTPAQPLIPHNLSFQHPLPLLHPVCSSVSSVPQVQQSFEPTRTCNLILLPFFWYSLPPYILILFLSSLNSKVNHRFNQYNHIIVTTFPTPSTFSLLSSFCLLCAFTILFKSNSLHLLPYLNLHSWTSIEKNTKCCYWSSFKFRLTDLLNDSFASSLP